jgi:sialidase-1
MSRILPVAACIVFCVATTLAAELTKIPLLVHSDDAPRRTESDFVQLRDGRLLLIYSKFTGGVRDASTAHLASRVSTDGGRTWSQTDEVVVANEGTRNTASVSLNRLADGRIALLYLRKNSLQDCRPCVRFSADEAKTWSEPTLLIADDAVGYYVMNNDRVVQLQSGRLIAPVSQHFTAVDAKKFSQPGTMHCYLSDDAGRTWRRNRTSLDGTQSDGSRLTFQEPGIVERRDGSLLMFIRCSGGAQYFSESTDGGETWSTPYASPLKSPLSPASIKRIPSTGDLVCLWNDHDDMPADSPLIKDRTPFRAAVSRDDGRTWLPARTLEDDPHGCYCYTAIEFVGDDVLLAYCASANPSGPKLADTQITRMPLSWLYGK